MTSRTDPSAHVDAVSLDSLPAWPLATSMTAERDYVARVEGTIPPGLHGTLYRNGPGRFDRAGLRKNHLLDGDGMIQAITIEPDAVRYRNRFVRTRKYTEESLANRFLYDTWSTRRPDADPTDPPAIENQAGVTVVHRNDTLYALDDGPGIYELDPVTLDTRGPAALDIPDAQPTLFTAHTRIDPADDSWTLVAGSGHHQHTITFDRHGRAARQVVVPLPRPAWMHDFLMTETHFVFVCHPLSIDQMRFVDWGWALWDSFDWRPDEGNLIVVADRHGQAPPQVFEAPTGFMWHGMNAFDRGAEIVVDYIGYTEPDHAFGPDPQLRAVMEGRSGNGDGPGTLRRVVLTPGRSATTEEVLYANCEFPQVPGRLSGRPYQRGFMATTRPGEGVLPSGVARVDLDSGEVDKFQFDVDQYGVEPIYAPDGDAGWLLTIVNDASIGAAHLAVFDAEHLAAGPVARVHLEHTTPFSFHGYWSPKP
ncbi:MAG: dioxygenase [Acidimicrobiales bacterium]|nr:MAG: dioxygenase [Acidimicrobiales bacterium]